mgnify:CR=1 FL=1
MSSNSEKYLLFFAIFVIRKGYPAQRSLSIKSSSCGGAAKVNFLFCQTNGVSCAIKTPRLFPCHIPISSAIFSLTIFAA